jgi:integrase
MKAYLELTEFKQLEEAATCLPDRLLIRVLRKFGCRISEALALRVEDIDFIASCHLPPPQKPHTLELYELRSEATQKAQILSTGTMTQVFPHDKNRAKSD